MKLPFLVSILGLGLFLSGCGDAHRGEDKDHDHAHDHAAGGAGKGGHVHTAPHGGVLVELGEHEFNVELVLDAAMGKLTLYVLDAHAENFVRLALPAIEVTVAGSNLSLLPVANGGTGETVGNTSQFEVTSEVLKKKGPLSGEVPKLEVKGKAYTNLKFLLP